MVLESSFRFFIIGRMTVANIVPGIMATNRIQIIIGMFRTTSLWLQSTSYHIKLCIAKFFININRKSDEKQQTQYQALFELASSRTPSAP
jgi:hypothetical protein